MAVPDRVRRLVIVLLVVAIAMLVARVLAGRVGAPSYVGRALYAIAVLPLVAAVLVVARDRFG